MKDEPTIDHAHLLSRVRAEYSLSVEALQFVPIGFAGVCYIVHGAGSHRYFLKLWPDTRIGRSVARRREASLRLTRALYERNLYVRVAYPLATVNGALWTSFANMPFAVFPLLPGRTPTEWSPMLMDEYARTIATIHRATPALADVLPPQETFAIPFETDLRHAFTELGQPGQHVRPGLRNVRDLVLPRRAEIETQLRRLHQLQEQVRQVNSPGVVCHTDLGGDNLLVDDHGRIYVLDWDEATVAPPEYDLHEARWLDVERVIAQYRAAGGVQPLHLEHFAFALLRRFLHDLTVRVLRMLDETSNGEQDGDVLAGIEVWGFAQWSALDDTLDTFASALRSSPP